MGGNNISAGSMLNKRVFAQSNKTGGGVKRNNLAQARVIIGANRHTTGRASYTSLSNQINGRKEVIYVGGNQGGCCSGKMSTMEKVAMYTAIAQQGLSLAAGIKELFSSSKTAGTKEVKDTSGNDDIAKLNQSAVQTFGQDNYSIGSQGLTNSLNLIDIDYDGGADKIMDALRDADTSGELYTAIQDAKAYKGQVKARLDADASNIDSWKSQLATLEGKAEGSIEQAEKNVDSKKDLAKKASEDVGQQERRLTSERNAYESAKAGLGDAKADLKEQTDAEATAQKNYDSACTATATARKNASAALTRLNKADAAATNARINVDNAQANLDNLTAQRATTTGAGTAALEAQIKLADAALKDAKAAKAAADKEQAAAKEAYSGENGALKAEQDAVKNEESMKSALATARGNVKTAATKLKEQGKITDAQLTALTKAQDSVATAETQLQEAETKFDTANDNLQKAEDQLFDLQNQKADFEMKIADYSEMQEAVKDLSDTNLKKYEQKLATMMQKEKVSYGELEQKYNAANAESESAADGSKKQRKAAKKEASYSAQMAEMNRNSAENAIKADQKSTGGAAWKPTLPSFEPAGVGTPNGDSSARIGSDGNGPGNNGEVFFKWGESPASEKGSPLSSVAANVAAGRAARMQADQGGDKPEIPSGKEPKLPSSDEIMKMRGFSV